VSALSPPPRAAAPVPAPIRLRLSADATPSQDPFVWSIAHEPAGVLLTFTLDLPPPFDQPFEARI